MRTAGRRRIAVLATSLPHMNPDQAADLHKQARSVVREDCAGLAVIPVVVGTPVKYGNDPITSRA